MAAFCELQQSACIRDCCPLCIDVELAWVLLGLMWVLSQPRPNVTVMQRVPPDYQIVRQSCVEVALSLPLQHLAVVCFVQSCGTVQQSISWLARIPAPSIQEQTYGFAHSRGSRYRTKQTRAAQAEQELEERAWALQGCGLSVQGSSMSGMDHPGWYDVSRWHAPRRVTACHHGQSSREVYSRGRIDGLATPHAKCQVVPSVLL